MKYQLDIRHKGDILELRDSDVPFPEVLPGEQIYVEVGNRDMEEDYGDWWIVRKRRHLFYAERKELSVLILDCEPDLDKGVPNI